MDESPSQAQLGQLGWMNVDWGKSPKPSSVDSVEIVVLGRFGKDMGDSQNFLQNPGDEPLLYPLVKNTMLTMV